MGAPSKDDIARIVEVAKNDCSMLFVESYVEISSVIVALADENERLRAEHSPDAEIAADNERLRVRNERLEFACETFEEASALSLADALKAEEETKRLRAERAEVLALLRDARTQVAHAAARGAPTKGNVAWLTTIDAKLRGAP